MPDGSRGRPEDEQDRQVHISECVLAGMSEEQIAAALRIPLDTLRTRYEYALDGGANAIKGLIIHQLVCKALKGDIAAARLILERAPKTSIPPAPEPEGKKEIAQREAKTATQGTEWDALLNPANRVQ